MKKKILIAFLLISLVPMLILFSLSVTTSSSALEESTLNHLTSIREVKKGMIEDYFDEKEGDVALLARNRITYLTMGNQTTDEGSNNNRTIERTAEEYFEEFIRTYNYYDLFLIDREGNIIYTVEKEDDYGTNLITGPYNNTGLANVYQNADEGFAIADYEHYEPSDAPAAFIAHPVRNSNGEHLGVVALQLSDADISRMMQSSEGLGETGEAYLVGHDFLMRSNSRFIEESTIGVMEVKTVATEKALQGETAVEIIEDYRGNEVLSAFTPLNINGLDWIIVAEMDSGEALSSVQSLLWKMVLALIAVTVIVIIFAIIFASKLTKPLLLLKSELDNLSQSGGDLTKKIQVNSNDEVGDLADSTNVFIENIKNIVTSVKANADKAALTSQQLSVSAEQTEQTSNQIAVTIGEIADGVTTQADFSSQILTKMQKSSEEVVHGREEAVRMFEQAKETTNYSYNGEQSIKEAIEQLAKMSLSVKKAADSVEQLGKRSGEIGEITSIITGISEQTNLLALNASIEAARAGEHGRGFAVVADEIRKLAEQSNANANQIANLIKSIQYETNETVELMGENSKLVQTQVEQIKLGGEALTKIVEQVEVTERGANEVRDYFTKIEENIKEVLESIEQISSITEQSAAAAQEVAAATEEQAATVEEVNVSSGELAHVAETLQKDVSKFIV
ncbi:methyl-accepting chemotaxis protein [Alkalihalobacterium sp. APHAB7]|uniref:methyl-accepting chemotaxis protein n=1 Tax=Alkalihalobacterium sp. APHAB7 TaxID=3402081 RepID=UPI003AAE3B51